MKTARRFLADLRDSRAEREISLARLAKASGLSKSQLWRIERGVNRVDMGQAARIFRALDAIGGRTSRSLSKLEATADLGGS